MTLNINYPLSLKLYHLLLDKQLTIAVAESCTGGGLSHSLTAISGASQVFDRGFVSYSNQAKVDMLGVSEATIEQFGSVSSECATEMANGALKNSQATLALSVTGNAGPTGGTEEIPVGSVFMAIADNHGAVQGLHLSLGGGRKNVQRKAIQAALEWLLDHIKNNY